MRAIEAGIFQGLSVDELHNKHQIPQDPNSCILCRWKSTHKRYHHTRDCQEIQTTCDRYNSTNSNNQNVTAGYAYYFVSNPNKRALAPPPNNKNTSDICHDTGTPLHLFNDASFFHSITYFAERPNVALGDEKTLLPITAFGTADIIMQQHRIRIKAYLVPSLGISLFSPTQHIKFDGCSYLLARNTMYAHFPTFKLTLPASDNFICMVRPANNTNKPISFDSRTAHLAPTNTDEVKILRLHPLASIPFRATTGSFGYDLTAFQAITINPHSVVKVPLGFALEIPHTYRCQIASRSSLAAKGINVVGGIIDNDYRGDITVILSNTTSTCLTLPAHSKIAQLLFIPSALPHISETQQPLSTTTRNTNGFGSTNPIACNRISRFSPAAVLPTVDESPEEFQATDPLTPKHKPCMVQHSQSHAVPATIHIANPPASSSANNTGFFPSSSQYVPITYSNPPSKRSSPRHWYETAKNALLQLNLKPCPNAPCIFTGQLLPNKPPIYVGMYVDDFLYFSSDPLVEQTFEKLIPSKTSLQLEFNGPLHHFLGVEFTHSYTPDGHLSLHMSQEADIHQLLQDNNLHTATAIIKPTPYRSGHHPVDSIPNVHMSPTDRLTLESKLRTVIGSLNWLATQTRPDIATITNIIAQYQSNPSPGHLEAARYVLRYLKGTSNLGITFSSQVKPSLESFVKFPIAPDKLHPFSDANWGPQASTPKPNDSPIELDLFKSRSISGFLHLFQLFTDNAPIPIQNDNEAAVKWSHNMTTKGLRHIQMRENAVHEQVQLGFITVEHIGGKHNPADTFTKEEKDINHFIHCRDLLVSPPIYSNIMNANWTQHNIRNDENNTVHDNNKNTVG
eukprot:CAMPEP_0176495642 /NCGR_PEP_ID=MMETSP0200_2-20121128/10769_1 /TAXON_ID=947934 /ORGANISM="Chaetoceros sp., Strain GSL56" /LENGTH=849 /DNA_ID=CAMNT_0017893541 /DNA_START=929 /DNA_END=3474 /DNA_ORIENTATION=+